MSEKKEYIERGAFIDFIDAGHLRYATEKVFSENDLVKMISERPAADVEPVVRCRNCEHAEDEAIETLSHGDLMFYCNHLDCNVEGAGFCSAGKQKAHMERSGSGE